jgi:hypothetical protein
MSKQTGPPIIPRRWGRLALMLGVVLIFTLAAAGCSSPPPPTAAPTQPPAPTDVPPKPTAVPEVVPVVQQPVVTEPEPQGLDPQKVALAQVAWESSPHGNTYDLGKGPNTYCSRCHSPQNWDPASKPSDAPTCITCKFPTDPELRIAPTMDFVEEEDWAGIGCETCHKTVDGVVTGEMAWLNPISMEHELVGTPNELCQKCHLTTSGVKASGGRGVTHEIRLGGSAHANWAGQYPQGWRPQYCSDCHDPHSTQPKDCVDCHADVLTLDTHMKGTQEAHADLYCLACHDSSGMLVGPHPDPAQNGVWTTLVTSVSRSGAVTTSYEKSHSIQWQVDCSRCHYRENPWELDVLMPDGSVPAPPSSN